jgi:hypothetical protein
MELRRVGLLGGFVGLLLASTVLPCPHRPLACLVRARPGDAAWVGQREDEDWEGSHGWVAITQTAIDVPLQLCDCHATIDQGVGCNRDGFFVAGYGSAGYPVRTHATLRVPLPQTGREIPLPLF